MLYYKLIKLLIQNPHVTRPNVTCDKVTDINFNQLRSYGIRCLIFDRDNTLTAHLETVPYGDNDVVIKKCCEQFEDVVLVSNSQIEEDIQLGLRVIKTISKKPFNFHQIRNQLMVESCRPEQIAVIGDRVLTDMLLANMNGCVSILVKPIDTSKEQLGIRVMRMIEQILWSRGAQKHPCLGDIQNVNQK